MTLVYFLLYNIVFVPLFFVAIHIGMLFNPKLRLGVLGRYRVFHHLRKHKKNLTNAPVMVVHCASMGEFEHIKPFLLEFKKERPDFKVVVLFFSPSGYENVRSFPAVDLFLYTPFDWFFTLWRFLKTVRPTLWIVAKHDVWPNQVWLANWFHIPIFLINASLHGQSSRLLPYTRAFHRNIYHKFTGILVISEADRQNFLHLADASRIQVVGDTKYDQVFHRREESQKRALLPEHLCQQRWIFVAGSTWPEDHRHLIPALQQLLPTHPELLAIICPHEPTPQHLRELEDAFPAEKRIRFSQLQHFHDQSVIIVDRIGILANLYSCGKVAYVGGSFKQNIHNVLEPAVYEIPVLFGPVNQNSHEAQLLKANGGAFEVHNAREVQGYLEKFLKNDVFRQEVGKKAFQVVQKNAGATRRTLEVIFRELEEREKSLHPGKNISL